jgi:hypothetical protein
MLGTMPAMHEKEKGRTAAAFTKVCTVHTFTRSAASTATRTNHSRNRNHQIPTRRPARSSVPLIY